MEKLVKGALLTFVSAWGISRGIDYVNGLLNVRKFSKIADFKLSRIHQISFVGESLPYPNSIVIAGKATTTISNIEVHVNTAKALFDYAYEAIAKVISFVVKKQLYFFNPLSYCQIHTQIKLERLLKLQWV